MQFFIQRHGPPTFVVRGHIEGAMLLHHCSPWTAWLQRSALQEVLDGFRLFQANRRYDPGNFKDNRGQPTWVRHARVPELCVTEPQYAPVDEQAGSNGACLSDEGRNASIGARCRLAHVVLELPRNVWDCKSIDDKTTFGGRGLEH